MEFDQTEFTANFTGSHLDDTGFVYVPHICQEPTRSCRLHTHIHGCGLGRVFLNTTYAQGIGILEWAAPNDMIVLFPQVNNDTATLGGCWDLVGYTGEHFIDQ